MYTHIHQTGSHSAESKQAYLVILVGMVCWYLHETGLVSFASWYCQLLVHYLCLLICLRRVFVHRTIQARWLSASWVEKNTANTYIPTSLLCQPISISWSCSCSALSKYHAVYMLINTLSCCLCFGYFLRMIALWLLCVSGSVLWLVRQLSGISTFTLLMAWHPVKANGSLSFVSPRDDLTKNCTVFVQNMLMVVHPTIFCMISCM